MVYERTSVALLLSLLVVAIGCQKGEEIVRYTVEKPPPLESKTPLEQTPNNVPVGEPTDRTLAAIVLLDDQGWFFKLTGPKDEVAAASEAFEDFLKSVRFTAEGKPQWTLPKGWQQRGGSQIRYATLVLSGATKPLEVSVTVLPKSAGDDEQYKLVNVNRWRNQLRMPPISADQMVAESKQISLEGATATVVNLLGTAAGDSMGRPPFMSGARDGN